MRKKEKSEQKKRRGRGWLILLAVIAWLLLVGLMLLILDAPGVRFYMVGDEDMTIEYGTDFTDPGVYAVPIGRLLGEGEEHLELTTYGSVDPHTLGSYTIRYRTQRLFTEYETERRVNVVDTTPPVIELKHLEGSEPTWLTGYAEEGYTAWDEADGDLSGKVDREALADRVRYTVSDSSGNVTTVERVLPKLNYQPPTITLLGDDPMTVEAALSFEDPGCTAQDVLGNDLTDYLEVDSGVIPWLAGDYEIRYTLTSDFGDSVSAVRHVTVVPVGLPEAVKPEGKVIYLTFDDGPGPYTAQLLDILKAYGVKATFFVTNQAPKYLDLIGRAYREGHSIGVHTSVHDYDLIYSSEEAYFKDFFDMEEIVFQQTGEHTRMFRFPGGSSNTVSSFNPGIMSRLTRAMNDLGYQYFDWNVVSGDAGETNKTKKIVEKIEEGCRENRISIILQHDIKDYSVAAVEDVIIWGLQNGYSFRALELDSPAMHHGVNN